jgi:hypothetical protein
MIARTTSLLLLALQIPSFSQVDVDPFARVADKIPRWPQSIAPSEEQLKSFNEPSLKAPAPADSTEIRFIWVPTFNKPVAIRATKTGDKRILKVVRMSGLGGYDWGKIEIEKSVEITDPQWKTLAGLASADGARKPTEKAEKELRENFVEAMSGLDGSTWFLEVRDTDGYTVEGVPNPIIGDAAVEKSLKEKSNLDLKPFLSVCLKLFDFSGLEERPSY